MLSVFHVFTDHLYFFLELSPQLTCPFIGGIFWYLSLCSLHLDINFLLERYLVKVFFFPHSVGCLLTLLIVSFAELKILNFMHSHLLTLANIYWAIGVLSRKLLAMPVSYSVIPMFFSESRSFGALCFTLCRVFGPL